MKFKYLITVTATAFISMQSYTVFAQDWPQFLGPERNSTSSQKGLLKSWPAEGPEVIWSAGVGIGFGGPVVKDGKVYLLDRDDETGDIMRCFDLQSGKELWKYAYSSPGTVSFPGSRSVPLIDDQYVYSCGPNGDLYCFDINSHKPVWHKNIWTDFGGKKIPVWAVTQSPIVYDNLLIIASQAPDAGVVAYNKKNGEIVWKTASLGNESYVSPKVINLHGEDQIVMVTSSTNKFAYPDAPMVMGNVVGLDPKTGKKLWEFSDWDCHISVPCAVDAGNNKLLIAGGYERGATMIEVHKNPNGSFSTSEVFTTLEFGDQTKPPVFHDGYFYAQYRTNSRRDGLVCMDTEGNIKWKTGRDPGFDRGSMIVADGLILATDGMKKLYLFEPDPTGFKPLASADLLIEGSQNWAPIALADGKLLIRNQNEMFCVQVAE